MCEQSKATLKITDYTKKVNGEPLVMKYEGTAEEMDKIFKKSFSDTVEKETRKKK